jgi:beta-glucosidase
LQNIRPKPGNEVSQLYLAFPKVPSAPKIALLGFQRVSLKAGEQKEIHFELSPHDLSYVALDGTGVPGRSAEFSTTTSGPLPR